MTKIQSFIIYQGIVILNLYIRSYLLSKRNHAHHPSSCNVGAFETTLVVGETGRRDDKIDDRVDICCNVGYCLPVFGACIEFQVEVAGKVLSFSGGV